MIKFSSFWALNHDLFPAEKVTPLYPMHNRTGKCQRTNKHQQNLHFFLLLECLNHFFYLPNGLEPGNGGKEGRRFF